MKEEKIIDGILYSANKNLLQVDAIHNYLSKESYWAEGIPKEVIEKSIEGSVCFAAYDKEKQVAFARVITDGATFAYLADVFVIEGYRGRGISTELMLCIMNYKLFKGVRRFMLATKDAHSLYEKFGFKALASPNRFMEIKPFENYNKH